MPKTILVADDEEALCRVLKKVLAKEGYRVLLAPNGRRALALLKREEVHVVLLDLKMPGIGGLEILKRIRALKKGSPAVVILTAYASLSSAREAMELGAVDYLTKPFDLMDVKKVIREALGEG